MKVDVKGHTTLIKNTAEGIAAFCEKVTHEHVQFATQNVIIDLTHVKATLAEIKLFSTLSKTHCKGKKSFVIVAHDLDYNAVPSQLHVVPSIQEAHDIIEMEEIERDLGF
ncbi:MAG: hypothetical protein RL607_2331 [Bacteroidota bacterium]|jgi:hypothetical protein